MDTLRPQHQMEKQGQARGAKVSRAGTGEVRQGGKDVTAVAKACSGDLALPLTATAR